MGRVVHFEIHAEDPARAAGFYGRVFGWSAERWPGPMEYWIVKTGDPATPGIDGGIVRRMGPPPVDGQAVNAFVCTVDVADLDAAMARVQGEGCPIVVPKMAVPGVGWLAYAKDTEGNILGMMQADPAAR